ncbi:MAG: hypothetical protein ACNY01_05540 [Desulfobacteria bacterium]
MECTHYQLVLQLKTPLHIGYRKVGNLMQTRSYVTGKVLWAALTARFTRDLGKGTNGKAYAKMGDCLKHHFRFGYLWPAVPHDSILKVEKWNELETFFPFDETENKNLLTLKKLYPHPKIVKSAYFDYCFLDSYAGTSIDQHNFAADEGTLHDTEFITPHIRISGLPVYLVGSLWVDESLPHELSGWMNKLNHIRLGGEQSYGWGKVYCIYCKPIEKTNEDYFLDPNCFSWLGHIPAHTEIGQNEMPIQGMVEPLVGWERQIDGKQKIVQETIAFVPGSYVKDDNVNFTIGDYGVWKEGACR